MLNNYTVWLMNAKQGSIYGMQRRLKNLFVKYRARLEKLPKFLMFEESFTRNLDAMRLLNYRLETDISAVRVDKQETKIELVDVLLQVCEGVRAYALVTGHRSMTLQVNFNGSELLKAMEERLVADCLMVYELGVGLNNEAEAYGVSQAVLADLKKKTELFSDVLHAPKDAQLERKRLTAQLDDLFEQQAVLLETLDALMELLKRSDAELYALYQDTRRVVYHGGSLMVRGAVTDAATKAALSGACVEFIQNSEVVLTKLSADGGGFSIKTIDEGVYTVRVSKLGYATQMVSLTVDDGKLAVIEVGMVINN